jgi:hypothetical protein
MKERMMITLELDRDGNLDNLRAFYAGLSLNAFLERGEELLRQAEKLRRQIRKTDTHDVNAEGQ